MNNNHVVKEYFDMNNHYIKISLINNKDIHIVSYNTNLLNGIKYETIIKAEEIIKKTQDNNFTCENLYSLINQKIGEKKFTIKSDENNVNIVLLETSNVLNQNADIQIIIPKNKSHKTTEYEKVLSNEITKLKEENKSLVNSINELKNMIELNNCIRNNNNFKSKSINKSNNLSQNGNLKISKNDLKNSNSNIIMANNIQNNPKNLSLNSSKNAQNNKNAINHNIDNNIKQNSNIITTDKNTKSKEQNNLSLSRLCDLNFNNYPSVKTSQNDAFFQFSGYGANSYNGTKRDYNEDRVKIILDHKLNKAITDSKGKARVPNINYFAIYDGHGGKGCSNYLEENLHNYIFSSDNLLSLPLQVIYQAYEKAELNFELIALDKENKKLLDKSGSCALSALFIDNSCFIINLGDSRGLYSFNSGKELFQITRDHKPNDPIERKRIEKVGGKIYKDTRIKIDGVKIQVNEKEAPGLKFPYRISPGNLAVSIINNFFSFR